MVFEKIQIISADFNETFAPVVKISQYDYFGCCHNWELLQIYVDNVNLHKDLSKEVYMKLPPDFSFTKSCQVCRNKKSCSL